MKRKRLKTEQILQIRLKCGYCYGQVLNEMTVAFFDKICTKELTHIGSLLDLPIAFIIKIDDDPVATGRWTVIGQATLSDEHKKPQAFYRKDILSGEYFVYQELPELAPFYERPSTRAECADLEESVLWGSFIVERRLEKRFCSVARS